MVETKPVEIIIAGVDEVGRGCLFGPVFAGAVILDSSGTNFLVNQGLTDSKKLKKIERAKLDPLIKRNCIAWGLGQSSAKEIDEIGIREATEIAMIRALQRLSRTIDLIIVDGILPIRNWDGPQQTLVKGDSKFASISAASVIAKQSRDSLITRLAKHFPEYGLEKHVGYGTASHIQAIKKSGPSSLHRKSFLSKILRD